MKTTYEYGKELILKTTPANAYPGKDYGIWKQQARKKLSNLLGMDKFSKVAPQTEIVYVHKQENFTEIRFTFQSEEGYRVPCHLLLPDGVENPPEHSFGYADPRRNRNPYRYGCSNCLDRGHIMMRKSRYPYARPHLGYLLFWSLAIGCKPCYNHGHETCRYGGNGCDVREEMCGYETDCR